MNDVWAIVPVKPLNRAKSRLADVLSPDQREELAAGLLERTVRMLLPLPQIQGVMVISRDTKALALARDWGAQTVQESGAPELNNALYRATSALRAWGAGAALVVPADLPLLAPEDIETIVALGKFHNTVALAPDRHEQGTNLLMVRPPGLIPYSFGIDSFATHQRLAREAGAAVQICRSRRIALDLDTADDLEAYYSLAGEWGEHVLPYTQSAEWLASVPRDYGS